MARRAKPDGRSAKGRGRKVAKPKRRAKSAASPRKTSSDKKLQQQLAQQTRELADARRDLARMGEQQAATLEVLKVISGSHGELDPVFQSMLANAMRLCEAKFGILYEFGQGRFRAISWRGVPPSYAEHVSQWRTWGPHNGLGRIARTKKIAHIPDVVDDRAYAEGDPERLATVKLGGVRTALVVPMLKDDELVGAFVIYRQRVRPFTGKQIELAQNFAAQAVIAIENTRLLKELRQRTDDLSETLEQQTATSEVLKIISTRPGELEPVFQAILENAVRICEAKFGVMFRFDGDLSYAVATLNLPAPVQDYMRQRGGIRPTPGSDLDQVSTSKQVIQTIDMAASPNPTRIAKTAGVRTQIAVPMLKDGEFIGAVTVYRQEVRPFTDKQIALVQNFAAQAVIAIENTRLLNELRESLLQQTATADVLQTISSSPGELKPVFESILENATRICEAGFANLWLHDGKDFRAAAIHGAPAAYRERLQAANGIRPGVGTPLHDVIETRRPVQMADLAESEPFRRGDPVVVASVEIAGTRSLVCVPMLKEGELIGAIAIYRQEVRPFTDKQIRLVENFAAQAVIAIENARLLNELRQRTDDLAESLEHQTATGEVLSVISQSPTNTQPVFDAIAESAARLCEAVFTVVWLYDGDLLHYASSHNFTAEVLDRIGKSYPKRPDRSLAAGRAILDGTIAHVPDMLADPAYAHELAMAGNWRASVAVPMLRDGRPVGAISVGKAETGPFAERQMQLLTTFADQAVIAIENVRLFDEIQDKSRQLAEASQHKSQFLASMSHELRTPLNAILGYTELIADGIYGAPPDKMQAVLKRVESNGRHLLGLINAVLDLSKIEAGQLTLDLADYSLQNVAQTVYNAVEPLAIDKKLAFRADIEAGLPPGRGDERRLTQVLLNLVGNAIKFTDAGEVVIKAGAGNGDFYFSVRDTGPGISASDQAKLFQEFQQADNPATRKKEGTGLGLAISKRIVEMHGGRIWIESQLGQGSTFFVTVPVHVREQVALPSS